MLPGAEELPLLTEQYCMALLPMSVLAPIATSMMAISSRFIESEYPANGKCPQCRLWIMQAKPVGTLGFSASKKQDSP